MGKRFRRDKRRPWNKKAKTDAEQSKKEENFAEWVLTNDSFIQYYKAQQIVAESEWDAFMASLAKPLPTTFRINHSCAFPERIRSRIAQDFRFDGLVVEEEPVEPIRQLSWYPEKKGFHWSVERRRIRKLPILAEFQKWLMELSDSGSITRQEAVSMIPPLVLNVEPHHKVLDMCAAPGSKTSQLLESLHAKDLETGQPPTGMVMANDVDIKRAYMLVHQSKRIGSPALVVTCHEAQHIPFLGEDGQEQEGFFDRILCDAPCSGDGTLRKNPIIWKQWNVKNGLTLHPLQLQIAKRGASLLKVGGYMCYSTCTFNPVENEAVVAELLRWAGGALELVDVSNTLPLLKRRPGLSSWRVMDLDMQEVTDTSNLEAVNQGKRVKLLESMFPPTKEEAESYDLRRCMRCVPHDEDTGGFFICLLKKIAPTPSEPTACADSVQLNPKASDKAANRQDGQVDEDTCASEAKASDETTQANEAIDGNTAEESPKKSKKRRDRKNKSEEYVQFPEENWQELKACYAMDDAFPRAQLLTRSEESKSVTFVTQSVSMRLIERLREKRVKLVYTGIKIFERSSGITGPNVYRLSQGGIPICLPYIRSRVCPVKPAELQLLLERRNELLSFTDLEPSTCKYLENVSQGSVICTLDPETASSIEKKVMNVAAWRGKSSVASMTSKPDGVALIATMKELNLFDEKLHEQIVSRRQENAAKTIETAGNGVEQGHQEAE